MGFLNTLKSSLATAGYNLKLPGLGVTLPIGTPYNKNQTPSSVYNATQGYTARIPQSYNATTAPQNYVPRVQYPRDGFYQRAAPSTGGQPASGSPAGTAPRPQVLGASTQNNNTQSTDNGQQLADEAYRQAADRIRGYEPLIDSAYNTGKGDIEGAISQAEQAAATQKQELESGYGSVLRNQLQTYQDLNRQRQGMFSSLGTLDSSAFGEQQFRGDQAFGEQKNVTEQGKVRDLSTIDQTKNSYVNSAKSQLSQLATQYQQGKNAIAQALASNDLESASAINDYIQSIQGQAQKLAQGAGSTVSSIRGVAAPNYSQTGQDQQFQQMYAPQATQNPGQGYISPSGKRYNSYQDYIASLGQPR